MIRLLSLMQKKKEGIYFSNCSSSFLTLCCSKYSIEDAIFPHEDSPFYYEPLKKPATSRKPADPSRLDYSLAEEVESFGDIQFLPIPSGRAYFGGRGIFQFQWALKHYDFTWYMRLDDDSFPCFPQILYELQFRPCEKFLWVKYWHQPRRTRIDENFMVLSRDLVEYVTIGTASHILPFDPDVDFGINFTLWTQTLNLTVFDDVNRLDSHQSLLTQFMHHFPPRKKTIEYDAQVAAFCSKYIYAHHVSTGMMDEVYKATKWSIGLNGGGQEETVITVKGINLMSNSTNAVPPMTRPTDFLYDVDTDFYTINFPSCKCKSMVCPRGDCKRTKSGKK